MAQILFIEPDAILAKTYQRALRDAGHKVVSCANAQQGIMAADTRVPDIVILELQLIEHSGIEFLYEFRSYLDWQTIPIIVQTHVPPGEFSDSAELLDRELGVCTYLYKPHASLRRLVEVVEEALLSVSA